MITTLRLTNYKNHSRTQVDLGRLNVIMGPNGCGKTSILQALHHASQLCIHPVGKVFSAAGHPDVLVRQGHHEFEIGVDGRTAEGPWSLSFHVREMLPRDEIAERQGEWTTTVRWSIGSESREESLDPESPPRAIVPRTIRDAIASSVFLHFDARRLAAPSPTRPNPRLEHDGSGLATVLADLALNAVDRLERIKGELRRLVPTFQDLRVDQTYLPPRKDTGHMEGGFRLRFEFLSGSYIPAHAVSEGTLILLGLLTLLNVPGIRPRLILLDDIEQALHPKAQWELVGLLRQTLREDPGLQIVATSHSPYLVDELELDEVVVAISGRDGLSHCAKLADHPQAEEYRGALSTGEFLSSEDEAWVLGETGNE